MSDSTSPEALLAHPQPARSGRTGLVLVHTGPGKGKTTAALGLAFRALGWGWKILMIQFIKGSWKTGEKRLADALSLPFEILPMGGGCELEDTDRAASKAKCVEAWRIAETILQDDEHDLVILDEINIAMAHDHLDPTAVTAVIRKRPRWKSVVITGRRAPPPIIELADLVTEFTEVKHPFRQGVKAQKGIEF